MILMYQTLPGDHTLVVFAPSFLPQPTWAEEYTDFISAEGLDSPTSVLIHDSKPSDGEASATLELWGIQSSPLSPSLPGRLWPIVVAPDRVLSISQTELFDI